MGEMIPILRNNQMSDVFTLAALRSHRRRQMDYDDGAAGAITETWADVSKWTGGANKPTVNGSGYMVAQTTSGSGAGMTLIGATIKPWETATYQCEIYTDTSSSGGLLIGLSKDVDLATPAGAATNAYGIMCTGNTIQTWTLGVGTAMTAPDATPPTATYLATVVVDENYMSFSIAQKDSGYVQYRHRVARPASTDLIPFLFNSSTSQIKKVGSLQFRKGIASAAKSTGITAKGPTVIYTMVGTTQIKIVIPQGADLRTPRPILMQFHGNGSDENIFTDNSGQRGATSAFLAAGFILASARYATSGTTWGAQASLDAYYALYQYLIDHVAMGPIVIYANSMGGIESLLAIAEGRIKGVVGWIGQSATYNLAEAYANASFTALITAAYGITGTSPYTYAEATAGHDPALMPATAWRGLPMAVFSASDDTIIPKATNGDALISKVTGYAAEVVDYPGITGGHSFATGAWASAMVVLAAKWAGV